MVELTERQKFILTLVIHEYVRTAQPVGSKHLVERYRLDLSPATIRNELSALTEMGLLRQPHTSAGRIPTEEGYRLFVGRLLQDTALPDNTRKTIVHQFYQMRPDVDQWVRLAASVAAYQSRAASLVTAPHPEQAVFKHVELISTRGRQVLMVLVLVGGEVRQKLIALEEPIAQEALSLTGERLTHLYQSKEAAAIRTTIIELSALEQTIVDWVLEEMVQNDSLVSGEVYMDGMNNVLAEPEFAGSEDARRALRLLEEKSLLNELISRTTINGANIGGVQVLIGSEGVPDELRPWSIVLARYGTPGETTGTLGVLGPIRMSYGRTISIVRFLSGLLSDLVSESQTD